MTIQQAAEATYPGFPDADENAHNRAAFIAGAEWALERAARVVESNLGRSWIGTETPRDIAAAIRSLSTTTIPISGSSGSDSENTIKEEK